MNTFAVINIACQQLGLDEDVKRALYVRVTGLNSLRLMSERQRLDVVDELKRRGFRVTLGATVQGKLEKRRPLANRPWSRLIHALWKSCARYGVIEDGSVKALNKFCSGRIAHYDPKIAIDVDFLSKEQADPIITALKAMEKRGAAAA